MLVRVQVGITPAVAWEGVAVIEHALPYRTIEERRNGGYRQQPGWAV
jgi:hypothetical protein